MPFKSIVFDVDSLYAFEHHVHFMNVTAANLTLMHQTLMHWCQTVQGWLKEGERLGSLSPTHINEGFLGHSKVAYIAPFYIKQVLR